MHDILKATIRQVEEYSKQTGLSTATVCNLATNNARLLVRLRKRAAKTDEDVGRLRKYMASNPVEKSTVVEIS